VIPVLQRLCKDHPKLRTTHPLHQQKKPNSKSNDKKKQKFRNFFFERPSLLRRRLSKLIFAQAAFSPPASGKFAGTVFLRYVTVMGWLLPENRFASFVLIRCGCKFKSSLRWVRGRGESILT
jgi:hypothetical protein